ncbi:MAG: homoserine O-acetyltransferase/O-succinyltransferase family protein, partial [bacterium]
MRVLIGPDPPLVCAASGADRGERAPAGLQAADGKPLTIGLINNMPDGAVEWTERQFLDLLDVAAGQTAIHIRLFSLPEIPRSETVRRHMNGRYCRFDELWDSQLDALIVTGTEPHAALLTEEPYWRSFTRVIDWAQTNTISTVWSCLAAHAAVLH